MKKLTIFLFGFMLISVGFLNGCTETNKSLSDEELRFVGTWVAYSENFQISMTFYSDGTFKQSVIERNWEVKNGLLLLTGETDLEDSSYNYYFTEDDNKLHLQTTGTDVYVAYSKQVV